MPVKCMICYDIGKYHKESDNDSYEGYKLAPWYPCSCEAGVKMQKTHFIDLEEDGILVVKCGGTKITFAAKELMTEHIPKSDITKFHNIMDVIKEHARRLDVKNGAEVSGPLFEQVHFFNYGMARIMPPEWIAYEELMTDEFQVYLKLKKKFEKYEP